MRCSWKQSHFLYFEKLDFVTIGQIKTTVFGVNVPYQKSVPAEQRNMFHGADAPVILSSSQERCCSAYKTVCRFDVLSLRLQYPILLRVVTGFDKSTYQYDGKSDQPSDEGEHCAENECNQHNADVSDNKQITNNLTTQLPAIREPGKKKSN